MNSSTVPVYTGKGYHNKRNDRRRTKALGIARAVKNSLRAGSPEFITWSAPLRRWW